ncbi:hypothetical protein Clacol_002925 [Clathrus columnatus]|uniref:Extracellular mutant protein 11 C-terminal domain-containing protein n=1 Tax=Clathrus columnatus TaxID=1419009 RepID=A0AAV5A814_9AGAM|nr:hypothetical protein Clacol_002925 [Clathrus columnatus]
MTQADGNRTRFFPLVGQKIQGSNSSINLTSGSETSSSSSSMLLTVSNLNASGSVTRTSSTGSEDDIIAQRTRMVETETLFKPRKDRNGKLNISGLIVGGNNKPRDTNLSSTQTATITEIIEENSENSNCHQQKSLISDDNTSFSSSNAKNLSFLSTRPLNTSSSTTTTTTTTTTTQAVPTFIPPKLNIFKVSELTVENHPVNQRAPNLKHLSRADHLTSEEMLMLSGDQLDYFQPDDIPSTNINTKINTMRAIGAKNNAIGIGIGIGNGNVDRPTGIVHNDTQHNTIIPYKSRIVMNGEKRGTDTREEDELVADPSITISAKRPRTTTTDNNNIGPDSNFLRPASQTPFRPNDVEQETIMTNYHEPSFATVLGHEIESYLTSHMDTYERAKARWTDCSREEWERGADEIVEKFTKILDFVKDHMRSIKLNVNRQKITLYASLQYKLDTHKKDRDSIGKMLKEAKDELVAKTGVLIEEGKN